MRRDKSDRDDWTTLPVSLLSSGLGARHAELFLSYSEGKPKQGVELSGPEGEPIGFLNLTREQIEERVHELLEKRRADAAQR